MEKEKLIKIYEIMLKIRYFEQSVKSLYQEGLIPGSVHLYTGQEAIAAGTCIQLNDDDYISSTHRGHGHIIARGGDLKKMMAELFGKETGYNGGRGGSMHIASINLGILGANSIVGAGIPMATGAAMSSWYRKSKQVVLCFFGDGATNQGTFHESLNIASNFNLPIVYICENNLYGVGTNINSVTKCKILSKRAISYSMQGITIDGNNPIEVYSITKKAISKARQGKGPTLIEAKTYRWNSHYEGELDNYRDKEEVKLWKERDPIKNHESFLLDKGYMDNMIIKTTREKVNEEIKEAIVFAKESPYPKGASALKYVQL